MHFTELGLSDALVNAVIDSGYQAPTPIQAQAIPPAKDGKDVFGCAQTGTGKTAAFTLPILQQISENLPQPKQKRRIRCLILTPTRELAAQIGESIATYGAHLPITHAVIFGGVGQGAQVKALRNGVDILVACPGRLLDLMGQGHVSLKHLQHFVLDEADRMLDMGFIHDVKKIISQLPDRRQTLFFSATIPPEIKELADSLLSDPTVVTVAPASSAAKTVEQEVYFLGRKRKIAMLKQLLKDRQWRRVLVFSRTKHGADRVAKRLCKENIKAEAIHGNKTQNARLRALEAFKSGKARVLVASDIAARGIDIDEVTHVVNFELPHEPETYVHRIGRTGRAGKSGKAVSFVDLEERSRLKKIERLIKKPIHVVTDHPYVGSEREDGNAATAEKSQATTTDNPPQSRRPKNQRRERRPPGKKQNPRHTDEDSQPHFRRRPNKKNTARNKRRRAEG